MKGNNKQDGKYFAVIDTETTWGNVVMSIGVAIADSAISLATIPYCPAPKISKFCIHIPPY